MNNQRRKSLDTLASELRELAGKVEDIKNQLETLKDEEQEYFDNMPESLQSGEKGEIAEAAISNMEDALEALPDLEEVATQIEGAAE